MKTVNNKLSRICMTSVYVGIIVAFIALALGKTILFTLVLTGSLTFFCGAMMGVKVVLRDVNDIGYAYRMDGKLVKKWGL